MFGITKDLYIKKDMKLVFSRFISRGEILCYSRWFQRADPGFQVRAGGGGLKKIAANRRRRENVWGILCEKSRFYAKKSGPGVSNKLEITIKSPYEMTTAGRKKPKYPLCDF
jgi:hypothetical protein